MIELSILNSSASPPSLELHMSLILITSFSFLCPECFELPWEPLGCFCHWSSSATCWNPTFVKIQLLSCEAVPYWTSQKWSLVRIRCFPNSVLILLFHKLTCDDGVRVHFALLESEWCEDRDWVYPRAYLQWPALTLFHRKVLVHVCGRFPTGI